MTSVLAISQIGQVAIMVQDLERAVTFYQTVLGLPLLFQAPPGLAFFQCGEVRLMLSRPEGVDAQAMTVLYYQVADIHAAYQTLQSHQVRFIDAPHMVARMPDHELWMVFFHDSEGNTVALMAEHR